MADDTKQKTKTDMYREAFEALGKDVKVAEFKAWLKKTYELEDVPNSAFYQVRKEFDAAATAPAPRVVASAAPAGSIPYQQLPELIEDIQKLVKRFGGDKAALIRFIGAL